LAFSCYRCKVDFDGNTFDLYPVTAIASIIIVTTLLSVMNRIRRGGANYKVLWKKHFDTFGI